MLGSMPREYVLRADLTRNMEQHGTTWGQHGDNMGTIWGQHDNKKLTLNLASKIVKDNINKKSQILKLNLFFQVPSETFQQTEAAPTPRGGRKTNKT